MYFAVNWIINYTCQVKKKKIASIICQRQFVQITKRIVATLRQLHKLEQKPHVRAHTFNAQFVTLLFFKCRNMKSCEMLEQNASEVKCSREAANKSRQRYEKIIASARRTRGTSFSRQSESRERDEGLQCHHRSLSERMHSHTVKCWSDTYTHINASARSTFSLYYI